ncbi:hypothetical protein RhiirC2_713891 [Rhizophagus irregularis]|uniref:Crinkler effector protein N-terminal domain-containing protein n=1 Tax=Rhizophagus irregularis TaxID=588596 RepID=A0A2N1N1I2_9GLOM|nr:hypothetical protein RhiirC2_713891 [Rhizophagus irregularis]
MGIGSPYDIRNQVMDDLIKAYSSTFASDPEHDEDVVFAVFSLNYPEPCAHGVIIVSSIFTSQKTVATLKDIIRDKHSRAFGNVDVTSLKLWEIPIPCNKEVEFLNLTLQENDELLAFRVIENYWNEETHIHIIVSLEVVKCKKIEEYIELEKQIILKPRKAVFRNSKKNEDLEKNVAEGALTNGLVIQDLENRIRNLEAEVIAKERIILEKSEANNILWEKIKALEIIEEKSTCQVINMETDTETQIKKKKKRPNNKKRKRARSQNAKTEMNTDLVIDMGDKDKDYLEKHFAKKSRDITFYDIPAYWSDEEILGLLNANVGVVQFINFKRCFKYKTVRMTLRFSKAYEKIYKEGGMNVSLTRNNDRTYFIRMFDSHLPYNKFKAKFCWQAIKRLEDDVKGDDILVIKDMVKAFHAFFGKIIRVKGKRFIILYFNTESDLMSAINKSIQASDIGSGLWIKKENDYINENGELQEVDRRYSYKKNASRLNGFHGEWDQQDFSHTHPARFRRHNQQY